MKSFLGLVALLGSLCLVRTQDLECGAKPDQQPWEGTDFFVVGGRDAEPGSWPWQLSLQYFSDERGEWGHTCGAVLVEPGWVLTAAHCLFGRDDPIKFRLLVGGHSLNDTDNEYFYVDQIFIHENYTQNPFGGYPNDACMLKLTTETDVSEDGVGLACLPDESFGDFADNENCWISGWGLDDWLGDEVPDILQEGYVPIPTNAECRQSSPAYALILRDFHVCVGDGSPSACRGDSGGPVTCLVGDTWYVAGIASFGPVFCAYWPMVYTRTSVHFDWIQNIIANN